MSNKLLPIPLVLDTDIGDDVDDALALAIALNSPEIELRGVTTVFRDAPRRAQLAREVLKLADRDIPVVAGASAPLVQSFEEIPNGSQLGRQFETLGDLPVKESSIHAVEFLRQQIFEAQQAGQKLTLAPIGPLTNIALLFAMHPEVVPLCRLAIMGGYWKEASAEWNILCDPEAAHRVFRSGADITMVGLDVTRRCQLNDEQVAQIRSHPEKRVRFLGELIDLWSHVVTLHDPLTLLTLFDDCVQFELKRIDVKLCGEERAHTVVIDGEPNARVAVDVDVECAVSLFMERIQR
jgi:inosine-uridine nucleoside N-ribohydrolase